MVHYEDSFLPYSLYNCSSKFFIIIVLNVYMLSYQPSMCVKYVQFLLHSLSYVHTLIFSVMSSLFSYTQTLMTTSSTMLRLV